ncbi:H-2 class II histocompatibility antigen, A-K alpha chain-like [Plectropomus leopardus]|uniref:H-2 class II histocompatibility antigen, A-K alpha chain-like n=1 Tax=Plectropomus leopardus TaxID=160734 RepID=UPI001C4BDC06|nr:H-2 class II histocompatibility antigen, A-K alpha chain-like [Plectropomus leopardus]
MTPVILLILFSGASAATPSHTFHFIYGCYDSGDVRVDILMDEDMGGYADFTKGEVVIAIPHIPQSLAELRKTAYEYAKASIVHCQNVLDTAKSADPGAPLRQDAPDISIYTRDEEEDGVMNTLFCLANHFYPPSINFTWTKNGVEVTDGVLDLRYRQNSDGTFHRISTLSFTPQKGDVYACSVEHQASHQPLSKNWELKERQSRVSHAAGFLGGSLVLCLMGIGAGAFFFTKQPN